MSEQYEQHEGGMDGGDDLAEIVNNVDLNRPPRFDDQDPRFRGVHNKSAPARIEKKQEGLCESNVFSYTTKFAKFFEATDIRTHDQYSDFYQQSQNPSRLPEPITNENRFWFEQDKYRRKNFPSNNSGGRVKNPNLPPNIPAYENPQYQNTSNLQRTSSMFYPKQMIQPNPMHHFMHRSVPQSHMPPQGVYGGYPTTAQMNYPTFLGGPTGNTPQYNHFGLGISPKRPTPPQHHRIITHSPLSPNSMSPSSPVCTSPTLMALFAANNAPLDLSMTDQEYLTKYDRERLIQERISKFYSLKDLKGKVYHLAKDPRFGWK